MEVTGNCIAVPGRAWPPQARLQSSRFLWSGPDNWSTHLQNKVLSKGNLKAKKKGEVFFFSRRSKGLEEELMA